MAVIRLYLSDRKLKLNIDHVAFKAKNRIYQLKKQKNTLHFLQYIWIIEVKKVCHLGTKSISKRKPKVIAFMFFRRTTIINH